MAYEIEVSSRVEANGYAVPFMNLTDLPESEIRESSDIRQIASQLGEWVSNTRKRGAGGMFDRGAYTPPHNPYDEMRVARKALAEDSIVSGVAELTEAYAFAGVKWEASNPDDADALNQWSADVNLDDLIRKLWRDEFTFSQYVATRLWAPVEYTVRGQTKAGNQRKKKYRFLAPILVNTLDPRKIVPIGVSPLSKGQLAWQAGEDEFRAFEAMQRGERIDPLMQMLYEKQYVPGQGEAAELIEWGINPRRLIQLSETYVFRQTATKGDYEKQPDIRLKSCFNLLDLKAQLMQSDRVTLIGSANYILVVRKGSKEQPAQPAEIENLQQNFQFIAKLPVIISDHRLEIEIVAPKADLTLNASKYDVLDSRILGRLLGSLNISSNNNRDNEESRAVGVARVMGNRRHMLRRALEREIARAIVEHPLNKGAFESEPNLVYTPRNISLELSTAYLQGLQALRTQREISRDTILEHFGLDQATEAQRLEIEEEFYDDIFKTQVPFAAANPAQPGQQPQQQQPNNQNQNQGNDPNARTPNNTPEAPANSGTRGGRPRGGGNSPQSPSSQQRPRTSNGNPSTRRT